MNKRELKELVALRAVELMSTLNLLHSDVDEPIPQRVLQDLREAVKLWSPSVSEVQQLKERLLVQ